VSPSGDVEFLDAGKPIAGCTSLRLMSGTASATATCTITYQQAGHHIITARYGGDANFTGSSTSEAQHVTVHPLPILGTVKATMTWTFFYTPTWTALRAFTITGAPVGSTVALTCSGKGCPFAKRINNVRKRACTSKARTRCPPSHPGTINLMRGFQGRRLKAGARIIVTVSRPQWIGKYYVFTIRPAQPPAIHIECLAPGGTKPGVGC